MNIAHIKNNRVVNILAAESIEAIKSNPEFSSDILEIYDIAVHPWGPSGVCDVDIGPDWKDRLKEKLGYCIFCGDGLPVIEETGLL
jgi:hypothetical protein